MIFFDGCPEMRPLVLEGFDCASGNIDLLPVDGLVVANQLTNNAEKELVL